MSLCSTTRRASEIRPASGNPVNLFSDANPATVETQFAWMQQYGLDGVALQRFSVDLLDPATLHARNIVLANVRQAADDSGRVFLVMYDLRACLTPSWTPSRADRAARCVLRPHMAEGLAQARRAEPVCGELLILGEISNSPHTGWLLALLNLIDSSFQIQKLSPRIKTGHYLTGQLRQARTFPRLSKDLDGGRFDSGLARLFFRERQAPEDRYRGE